MKVRFLLAFGLSMAAFATGFGTALLAAENHRAGRALHEEERLCEALEVSIDRLAWQIDVAEQALVDDIQRAAMPADAEDEARP